MGSGEWGVGEWGVEVVIASAVAALLAYWLTGLLAYSLTRSEQGEGANAKMTCVCVAWCRHSPFAIRHSREVRSEK